MGLSKSTYYYQTNKCINKQVNNYEQEIISAFNKSRKIYGDRKIKVMEWQHFLGHFLYRHLFSKSNWR
ncbi:hypothetical protein [Spiroplasma endosymbiont of Poecilobothrus nobilitatus]|uniref:hypothetical protein n=1 Tax=Spiroplasma endosymbiont of Poecilobothrus nobilitatus TaxID=1209220 RepID=UPI00313A99AA